MKTTFFTAIFCVLVCLPFDSVADFFYDSKEITDCKQKHKNPMDYTLCLDAAFVQVERQLMTWETNVEIKLEEISKEKSGDSIRLYKSAQRYFNKHVKATCQWQYLAMLPDMTSAVIMSKECQIYMTKDRIKKLQEMSEMKF
ncbi:DUF1311 domain-containing protein [Psychrosphaera ytuae]|uniref:DUF1311 domain-containing protein n=1 Tax=Psychrosphaera ytuae TaxID=2820710 RepID=A0A975DBB9_9GAMM|nr:lysozyme inhibitor LprI family protein [Psychrosphaera ytuae]QTH63981.1 DUF1311 domain-containing protein [Psychrosphaera ytuae]